MPLPEKGGMKTEGERGITAIKGGKSMKKGIDKN